MKATFLFCSALALIGITAAHAQVTTTPVGYVTITVNANSDTKVGVSMQQASVYSSGVTSVATGTITVPGTVPDVTTNPHYVLVTTPSGSLEGNWYEVTGHTSTTITVAEDLQAAGLTSSDTIKVIPFWTLDALFPAGGAIPPSPDPNNPAGQVLLNNLSARGTNLSAGNAYFYFPTSPNEGWYDVNTQNPSGNVVISPESYITIRNETGSSVDVVVSGSVPVNPVSNTIVSYLANAQDNQVLNPFPVGLELQNSNLFSSGAMGATTDPNNPADQLLIFEGTPSGKNPSPTKAIFYFTSGSNPSLNGYYDVNTQANENAYQIPAGAAFILRKAASSDASSTWTPGLPYTP